MTAGQVTLKPKDWPGFHGWEVLDDANFHLGLVGQYGDGKPYFRAFGVRHVLGLGDGPVAVELNFATCDEAVAWIVAGFPEAAEA